MSTTQTATPVPAATTLDDLTFDHINLNDVDTSYKAIDAGVYTVEINKMSQRAYTVKKTDSPNFGKEGQFISVSLTVVDDDKFSNRRLSPAIFPGKGGQISLKKISQATGQVQGEGQSMEDFLESFTTLNPPARFQVYVSKVPGRNNPEVPENQVDFFTAKPAN